jgi:hypothetical protein
VAGSDDDPKADVHAIAYEQAMRSIDQQIEQLEQLRGRAGTLVSAASVAAALIVGFALTRSRADHLSHVGITSMIVVGAALLEISITAVILWWPTKGKFRLDPLVIIDTWADTPPISTRSDVQRDMAIAMGHHWTATAWSLDRRHRWYSIALLAFLVELIALGVAVWDVTR